MRYLISIPERLLRAWLRRSEVNFRGDTGHFPGLIRRSRLYQAIINRLLRLVVELVGDVHGVYPNEPVSAGS